ncbi:MAG: MFS transporter [Polyangiaceae bacterium]|nr:MFS transporter [Polyangiaceae bacterium]
MSNAGHSGRAVKLAILVAALGYFVDIYDLVLFSIVRVKSLEGIGVAKADLLEQGVLLLNMQMAGMLVGGILWGMLGDLRGRLSVLFGSIFLYSIANIANGLVNSVEAYAALRLLAGIGLAGELGAGITLVSEIMHREARGYGTTIVASIGICGAVVAALVGDMFTWRTAYFVGGGLGLALLLLRIGVYESGMFEAVKKQAVRRGNVLMLFSTAERARRYFSVILIGVPIWYAIGILITFSPEIGKGMGMTDAPNAGRAIMFAYIGLAVGDLASGAISQVMRSRRRVITGFLGLTAACIAAYFAFGGRSLVTFYGVCVALGFATGYWAVFVTIASEQFGTNIRATATTTAPNFVRGAVVPLTLAFQALKPSLGVTGSAMAVGVVTMILAFVAARGVDETYGKDLDFLDH